MADTVPIIDFSAYGLQITDRDSVSNSELDILASNVCQALSTVGFLYIKNHGMPQKKIDDFFRINKTFFTQPECVKATCESPTGGLNGYQGFAKERLDLSKPGDLKESFNYTSYDGPIDIQWPVSVLGMGAAYDEFYEQSTKLSLRILDVISLCIGFSDRNFLRNCHQSFGSRKSPGTLRSLYYPPLPASASIEPGQLRCGEHSDYGTLTLLFQDKCGGLEVC
ncbi:2-oxoglutarate-dependent dioxygenase htyE-like [Haliotis rubra]|uniref:2-oxoglutarate-dependent dioxygenase htyE-like n=1 Tax=Haliotis rubra TaxID=36100 RepID=UPI001EE56B34|nr:2-oxoglutarate-dependent dioxygenase htyE-like [Haliotis rubra]